MNPTHDDLARDLADHLIGAKDVMVWTDMQLGPTGSPRPDVYTIAKTFKAVVATAYEIKVSAADLRADLTAGKWQSYLRYASAVTFCVPAGLPKDALDAIPRQCGLMVKGTDGWRHRRKPAVQPLTEIPWQAWLKLLIDGTAREGAARKAVYFSAWHAQRKLAKRHGEEVAMMLSEISSLPQRHQEALATHRARMTALDHQLQTRKDQVAARIQAATEEMNAQAREIGAALGVPPSPNETVNAAAILRDIAAALRTSGGWGNVTALSSLAQSIAAQTTSLVSLLTAMQQQAAEQAQPAATNEPRIPRPATHHSII